MIGESSTPKIDPNVAKLKAKSFSVQIVADCPCGGGTLIIHQIGGKAPITTQCPQCQTMYSLVGMLFEDRENGQRVRTEFKVERPVIVRPTGPTVTM
jgi:hypothetical protein